MDRASRFLICAGALIFVNDALAYIDPGSGSALLSAIIGFFVAIGLAIKTYWYKLKSMFVGKRNDASSSPDNNDDGPAQ